MLQRAANHADFFFLAILTAIFAASTFGLSFAAVELSKDTHVVKTALSDVNSSTSSDGAAKSALGGYRGVEPAVAVTYGSTLRVKPEYTRTSQRSGSRCAATCRIAAVPRRCLNLAITWSEMCSARNFEQALCTQPSDHSSFFMLSLVATSLSSPTDTREILFATGFGAHRSPLSNPVTNPRTPREREGATLPAPKES